MTTATRAPRRTSRVQPKWSRRREVRANRPCIYLFADRGWNLNWQCGGQVYRRLYSFNSYGGSRRRARAAAEAERDWCERRRSRITAALRAALRESPEAELRWVIAAVRAEGRTSGKT